MAKHNVFVMVGGISSNSLNARLFGFFAERAGERMAFDRFNIASLPFFSQDIENDPPAMVVDFKKRIQAADAILIVTPEYNRSFPGVLKNALDWGSRPMGKGVWAGIPAGLIGTSPGAIGTFGAQNQLRQVLFFLDLRVMQQPEFYFTFPHELENGRLPEKSMEFLETYIERFGAWITAHKK